MEVIIFLLTAGPMLGAGIAYGMGKRNKSGAEKVACLLGILHMALSIFCVFEYVRGGWPEEGVTAAGFAGLGLHFQADGFRMLLLLLTSFMWLVSMVVSLEYFRDSVRKNRYYFFLTVTLGAVSGIFLSGDLFTTFLFFEMMSFTSYVWVVHDETKEALRAGQTYLAIAVLGGMVLLMGLFLLYWKAGTLDYAALTQYMAEGEHGRWPVAASLCLLFGFGAKAGAFPLHIWLPKAHPVAPAPASALLSGILTKTGIFGILLVCACLMQGNDGFGRLLFLLGILTMLTGGVLALFGVDLKRTLACSSVSQIGFILMGAGMLVLLREEGVTAGAGTVLYLLNHALFKLLLFGCAGIIYRNAHSLDLNRLRGFGRKKPFLGVLFLSGSMGISGIPLFGGYIGKTLIHESIAEYGQITGSLSIRAAEWLFLLGGGMTIAYMAKLGIALFLETNQDSLLQEKYDRSKKYMTVPEGAALLITSVMFCILGLFPHLTSERLAEASLGFLNLPEAMPEIAYFHIVNLKSVFLSLLFGVLLYVFGIRRFLMKKESGGRVYVNRWNPKWDLENLVYRPVLYGIMIAAVTVCRILDRLVDFVLVTLRRSIYRDSKIPYELEEGNLATHIMGHLMDDGKYVLNRTLYKEHPIRVSFEHRLALLREELRENNSIISRSLSFGLFLFGIGLILTLIYMIWWQ